MADKLRLGKFESYTIVDNGLIETELLTEHEKMVYIVIRMHLNQEKQTAFPGMATIAREARICKSVVIKAIKGLEEKGLLVVKRQTTKYNEKKNNIYYFNDFTELRKAETVDELKKIAVGETMQLTDDEIIDKALKINKKNRQKLYDQLAKEFEKEKELGIAAQTKVTAEPSTNSNASCLYNYIACNNESQEAGQYRSEKTEPETELHSLEEKEPELQQHSLKEKEPKAEQYSLKEKEPGEERYSSEGIRALFDYDSMVNDYPSRQRDIDSVMDILYSAMNTTKLTIRIGGEDKPAMVVIGKLMKLYKESIIYAMDKFSEQTERIKNPRAYMLTILYNAPEQFKLDIQNQVSHDMAHWNDPASEQAGG